MASLRRFAQMCRDLANQHVEDPDVPAAPNGMDGYAKWTQIALILYRVELEKSLRETGDYLNEIPGVLDVFDLDEPLHCKWEVAPTVSVSQRPTTSWTQAEIARV